MGDDRGGTIWIQEATADDQAHDLIGAAIIRLGSRSLQEQALGAIFAEIREDLIITLAGEVIFLSGLGRAEFFALALDEHGEAAADLVIIRHTKCATRPIEAKLIPGERDLHGVKCIEEWNARPIKCGGQ